MVRKYASGIGVSAYRRIGVWQFRHADTPTPPYADQRPATSYFLRISRTLSSGSAWIVR
jgi:hypothetical protein